MGKGGNLSGHSISQNLALHVETERVPSGLRLLPADTCQVIEKLVDVCWEREDLLFRRRSDDGQLLGSMGQGSVTSWYGPRPVHCQHSWPKGKRVCVHEGENQTGLYLKWPWGGSKDYFCLRHAQADHGLCCQLWQVSSLKWAKEALGMIKWLTGSDETQTLKQTLEFWEFVFILMSLVAWKYF